MRITIDIDDETKAWEAYCKLKKYTKREPEVYLSSSGHGYHFIVRDMNISFDDSIIIRELCGDDPIRVRLDKITTYKPVQVLWTRKESKDKKGKSKRIKNFKEYYKKKVLNIKTYQTERTS